MSQMQNQQYTDEDMRMTSYLDIKITNIACNYTLPPERSPNPQILHSITLKYSTVKCSTLFKKAALQGFFRKENGFI